jgi:hypothetical protein
VVLIGSVLICLHLTAVGAGLLAQPSGPWGGPTGAPPQFAQTLAAAGGSGYLSLVRLGSPLPEPASRPGQSVAYLEVRLKDENGQIVAIRHIPSESANFWVRRREEQLVHWLIEDQPVSPPSIEAVAAPKQGAKKAAFWFFTAPGQARLREVPEHLLPRDGAYQPTEWMLLLVRSYARNLCRESGAASAEIVRHSKDPVPPALLLSNDFPSGGFEELTCNFGEFSR